MKVTVKNEVELLNAFSGKLAGCQPAEKMDTKDFVYPVTFEVDTKSKTFTIVKKEETTKVETSETTETTSSSKCKYCPYIFGGVAAIVVIAVLVSIFVF